VSTETTPLLNTPEEGNNNNGGGSSGGVTGFVKANKIQIGALLAVVTIVSVLGYIANDLTSLKVRAVQVDQG